MTLIAAACCALAVAVIMRGRPGSLRRLRRAPSEPNRGRRDLGRPSVVRLLCAAVGLVMAIAWGGLVGIGLGVAVAVIGPLALGRLESRAARQRRDALQRQIAECADLLSACLASGAPLTAAATATAHALGHPIDRPLLALADALALGADPVSAWRSLDSEEAMAPLARAAARSAESGAPLSALLVGLADDLRRQQRAVADAAARAAGVRAVGPLAAAFLPAFLMIGVVPVVVSLALPFLATGSA